MPKTEYQEKAQKNYAQYMEGKTAEQYAEAMIAERETKMYDLARRRNMPFSEYKPITPLSLSLRNQRNPICDKPEKDLKRYDVKAKPWSNRSDIRETSAKQSSSTDFDQKAQDWIDKKLDQAAEGMEYAARRAFTMTGNAFLCASRCLEQVAREQTISDPIRRIRKQ